MSSFTSLPRFTLLATLAATSLGAADSAVKAGVGSNAIVLQEFIYEKAPYPSCHASTIVETDKRELAAKVSSEVAVEKGEQAWSTHALSDERAGRTGSADHQDPHRPTSLIAILVKTLRADNQFCFRRGGKHEAPATSQVTGASCERITG